MPYKLPGVFDLDKLHFHDPYAPYRHDGIEYAHPNLHITAEEIYEELMEASSPAAVQEAIAAGAAKFPKTEEGQQLRAEYLDHMAIVANPVEWRQKTAANLVQAIRERVPDLDKFEAEKKAQGLPSLQELAELQLAREIPHMPETPRDWTSLFRALNNSEDSMLWKAFVVVGWGSLAYMTGRTLYDIHEYFEHIDEHLENANY